MTVGPTDQADVIALLERMLLKANAGLIETVIVITSGPDSSGAEFSRYETCSAGADFDVVHTIGLIEHAKLAFAHENMNTERLTAADR